MRFLCILITQGRVSQYNLMSFDYSEKILIL